MSVFDLCPDFNSRSVHTREVVQLFGHSFLGCGSYDLKCWQDCSPMSPLPSYTYQRPRFKQQTLVFQPESFREKGIPYSKSVSCVPPRGFLPITRDPGHYQVPGQVEMAPTNPTHLPKPSRALGKSEKPTFQNSQFWRKNRKQILILFIFEVF